MRTRFIKRSFVPQICIAKLWSWYIYDKKYLIHVLILFSRTLRFTDLLTSNFEGSFFFLIAIGVTCLSLNLLRVNFFKFFVSFNHDFVILGFYQRVKEIKGNRETLLYRVVCIIKTTIYENNNCLNIFFYKLKP